MATIDFTSFFWAKNLWWRTPVAAWEKVKVSRCCSFCTGAERQPKQKIMTKVRLDIEVWPGYERIWYVDQIWLKKLFYTIALYYCHEYHEILELISYDRIAHCRRNSFWSRITQRPWSFNFSRIHTKNQIYLFYIFWCVLETCIVSVIKKWSSKPSK